jgi:phenylpropionate dioxygenase-like ring-hydroxylating dioxygenase large terminal subunit
MNRPSQNPRAAQPEREEKGMLIKNAWYMAAWASEIGRDGLVARTLVGDRVVMYRLESGDPVALEDRCPHRFIPLHQGKLKGDALECGYHGLQFASSGACVFNPHGDGQISSNMKVTSYPVAERDGIIWIWMGEPALADPSDIHRFEFLADPGAYTAVFGYMNVGAAYQLVNDNLLDLSHTQFVHPLFQGPKMEGPPPRQEAAFGQDGDTLWARSTTFDVPPIPFAAMFTDLPRVDTFVDTYWHAPSVIHLDGNRGLHPLFLDHRPQPQTRRHSAVRGHLERHQPGLRRRGQAADRDAAGRTGRRGPHGAEAGATTDRRRSRASPADDQAHAGGRAEGPAGPRTGGIARIRHHPEQAAWRPCRRTHTALRASTSSA